LPSSRSFTNKTGKVAPEHKRLSRYGTMKFDEISALPIPEIAAPTSHLYLWCPNAMLPDGLAVMKAWPPKKVRARWRTSNARLLPSAPTWNAFAR